MILRGQSPNLGLHFLLLGSVLQPDCPKPQTGSLGIRIWMVLVSFSWRGADEFLRVPLLVEVLMLRVA